MTQFFDAANWHNLIGVAHGKPACFYGDGRPGGFTIPTAADIAEVAPSEFRIITSTGNGHIASILDGRPDNNISPAQVRGFVRERRARSEDAIIYTPRSYVVEYQARLYDFSHGTLLQYERLYWWIATLDGKNWSAAGLAEDLAANYSADIAAARIWGNQNNQLPALGPAATVDVSNLFLAWRP